MRALGEHLIVRLPSKQEKTEGGVVLPDSVTQEWTYGRVVSVGDRVPSCPGEALVSIHKIVYPGDIVVFDKLGLKPFDLNPNAEEAGLVFIHHEMLLSVIDEALLTERKLPLPAANAA